MSKTNTNSHTYSNCKSLTKSVSHKCNVVCPVSVTARKQI